MGLQATLKCVTYPINVFRNSIAESMVWCIEQAECAEEVVECIAESLSIIEVRIIKTRIIISHFAYFLTI